MSLLHGFEVLLLYHAYLRGVERGPLSVDGVGCRDVGPCHGGVDGLDLLLGGEIGGRGLGGGELILR